MTAARTEACVSRSTSQIAASLTALEFSRCRATRNKRRVPAMPLVRSSGEVAALAAAGLEAATEPRGRLDD
jgi:hypothetical protein